MFKRLFLAGTIAFPLYLMTAIQQSPPLADKVSRSDDRAEQISRKIDRKLQDFQQEVQRVRSRLSRD